MNRVERNRMVEANLPLVGYLVSEALSSATHLSRDDLAQAGAIALIKAVERFDPERGVTFGAYARNLINGAIQDEMRDQDWAKRATRTRIKDTLATQQLLMQELGRTPTVSELATALGVSEEKAAETLSFAGRTIAPLDETQSESLSAEQMLPEATVIVAERLAYLRSAVEALPERMRMIVTEVFLNERTVVDVAAELGVTHGAVSQQKSEAIKLLREGLGKHYDSSANAAPDAGATHIVKPTKRSATYADALASKLAHGLQMDAVSVA